MEAFREQYPQYKILLTFFSPSGYAVRKNYAGADWVVYLPADTPTNARAFVTSVHPSLAFFIKYEFWYHYLRELKSAQIPTFSFSAIFRPNQLFFKPWGGFYRQLLPYFDHIFVQNNESVALLRGIGITAVTRAGDTRFDRVAQVAAQKQAIPLAERFKAGCPLLVVGSAWPADMDVLIPFLNEFAQPLKVIIAPHEIHSEQIETWQSQLQHPSVRYSELSTNPSAVSAASYLFIDNIGLLTSLYQYGEFAFIGGAFGKGLHNCLEAATFGLPLFFGPNYLKFQEAIDLVQQGAAFPVQTTATFTEAFTHQYANPTKAARISRAYVAQNVGATAVILERVKAILGKTSASGDAD